MGFFKQGAEMVKSGFDSACEWMREHKLATVVIAVGVVAVFLGGRWIICRKDEIQAVVKKTAPATPKLMKAAAEAVPKIAETTDHIKETTEKLNIDVSLFLRNLPKGHKASAAKLLEAQQLGILLPDGKTIVDSFSYLRAA